jgi:primosomal protein N' (replication factor Y)
VNEEDLARWLKRNHVVHVTLMNLSSKNRCDCRHAAARALVAPPRRRMVWEAVVAGRCSIVVGARSALFLPFANLRLVVVDEEHDSSFKQEDGLVYHGRDLAVARARIEGAAVVLASATPSLETLWNARHGRYQWLRLGSRHGVAVLPDIQLLDLRQCPPDPQTWLSRPLREAIAETFARGEQSLLFLNRRGYAPVVLCRACGHRMTSPDTDSWLVEHRYTGRLVCHLTGFTMARPRLCPSCGAEDTLVSVGPGVERVEEEVRQLFPEARTAVFSSDTAPDARSARALIQKMTEGEIDILVATQAAARVMGAGRLRGSRMVSSSLSRTERDEGAGAGCGGWPSGR